MTTKTTKKPRAKNVQIHPYSAREYVELRTELLTYINSRLNELGQIRGKDAEAVKLLDQRLNDEVSAHIVLTNEVESLKNEQARIRGVLADMKTKIADISGVIPSFLRDTDALGCKVNTHDAQLEINFTDVRRTLGLHKQRLDKYEEQLDMYGLHIANLFGAHGDVEGVEKLIAENGKKTGNSQRKAEVPIILRRARDLLQAYNSWCQGHNAIDKNGIEANPSGENARKWSAVGAIVRLCSGELRHQVLLALCIAVDFLWHILPDPPAVLIDEQMIDWLNEWNDGMVRSDGDIIFAFNLAIRRAERA